MAAQLPDAQDFSLWQSWIDAWNRHDLEAILAHYTEDVTFMSRAVVELGIDRAGSITGKAALRHVFAVGLAADPELCFVPLHAFVGVGEHALHILTSVELIDDALDLSSLESGTLKLALQPVKKAQDTFGDKLVQSACHLVADDELGSRGQRPGNANPLALTAGKFMGIAVRKVLVQAHHLHGIQDQLLAARPGQFDPLAHDLQREIRLVAGNNERFSLCVALLGTL